MRNPQLRLGLLSLAPILVILGLIVFLPPDGAQRAPWMQFVGRFHLLTIHFPIALILLVPILELAGFSYRFDYLRLSAGFVLGFATLGATVAAMLGWFLARSGGYSGPLVTQHMWGGVSVAAVCWLCWILRARSGHPGMGFLYAVVLAGCVGLVGWTGYRGGQLSQGENHLIEFMPDPLREGLGISKSGPIQPAAAPNSFYAIRVEPIITTRCITCHGPDKQKGNLRLDSYGGLMRGGKNGAVVKAGDARNSDILRRITLAPDSDDFMPKGEPKRPLSAEEIKLIEAWVAAGASGTLTPDAIKEAPAASTSPPPPGEVIFEEIDPTAVAKQRTDVEPPLREIQKRFPNILEYESRSSANLVLNASILGPKFGDSDLAALAPLAGHITVADLSRTAITDHSAPAIAGMKQLQVLRLTSTRITDTTVQALSSLDQLESLNVFATPITSAALQAVAKLPKLEHLYVGQTAVKPGSSIPQILNGKVVF